MVDGTNVVPEVHAVLDRISAFATKVRSGALTGVTGKPLSKPPPKPHSPSSTQARVDHSQHPTHTHTH